VLWQRAFLMALAAFAVFGQNTEKAAINHEVRGRILAEGGVVIARAEVSFDDPSGQRFAVVRPKDGTFTLTLAEGEWRPHVKVETDTYTVVSIRAGNADLLVEPLRITDAGSPEIIVTMAASRPRVRVSGVVRDDQQNRGFSQLFLTDGTVRMETTADLNGHFEFSQVPVGNYRAVLVNDSDVNVAVTGEIANLDVRPRKTIEGRLTTADGLPLPHITILLHRLNSSDSPTRNVWPYWPSSRLYMSVPQGEYRVEVRGLPESYRIRSMTYGAVDLLRNTLKVSEGSGADEFQMTLEARGKPRFVRVQGRVVAPRDVSAIGVLLTSNGWSYQVETDPDGRFEFPKVLSGDYSLAAAPVKAIRPLKVGNKDIHDILIELNTPQMRQVRGQVVVEENYPLPRAWYEAITNKMHPVPGNAVPTQRDGTFVMNVAEGEHMLEVTGYAAPYRVRSIRYGGADLLKEPLRVIGESKDEIIVTYEVATSPWLKIAGHIIGTENLPGGINSVNVTLKGELTPTVLETGLKTGGVFEFPKVLPGAYTLSTEPNIAGIEGRTIVVSDRDLSGLDVVVPPQRQVVVRAQGAGTSPPRGYNLIVKYADGKSYQIFKLSNPDVAMVIGRKDIRCVSDSCGPAPLGLVLQEPVVVSTSGQVFTLRLPEGEYRLEVQDNQHKVRSIQYGPADLLHEALKIQGSDSQEVVLTFDP